MIVEVKKVAGLRKRDRTVVILKCDFCTKVFQNKLTEKTASEKLFHFCSRKCNGSAQKKGNFLFEKKKQTSLSKHGVTHPSQLQSTIETRKQTNKERYGVEHYTQTDVFKQQSKATNLRNLGVEFAAQSKVVQEKIRATCVERFGAENPFASELGKQKAKETFLTKYGVAHNMQNPEIRDSAQKHRKDFSVLNHWLTHHELVCVGSYEVAFVNWANRNQIDFDWQISHKMSNGKVYIIDAFIKTGEFANTWIEIKGWFPENRREKWEWFHINHPNDSQLWQHKRLKELKIMKGKKS